VPGLLIEDEDFSDRFLVYDAFGFADDVCVDAEQSRLTYYYFHSVF
jgi:hypothetical protein